jgi:hypothetical protein
MVLVSTNLARLTDLPHFTSRVNMNPPIQTPTGKQTNGSQPPAWSDGRRAAVVEAAYLLEVVRK